MSRRIAIVGAGIFGVSAALQLVSAGHKVKVFDPKPDILCGTTSLSTRRLHLGFHYPRDFATAVQSISGSGDFLQAFPGAVNRNFSNYYALARNGSKTSEKEFESFVERAELPGEQIATPQVLETCGLENAKIAAFWQAPEGAIDVDRVRSSLKQRCQDLGVDISVMNGVTRIKRARTYWRVTSQRGEEDFDVVIRATYGSDEITTDLPGPPRERIFEIALNLEIAAAHKPFGLTVVDGDFLTVLPNGFSSNFLVYAPTPSVIRREQGVTPSPKFSSISEKRVSQAESDILGRLYEWLPGFGEVSVVGRMIGVRTLLPSSAQTDARESTIELLAENFYEVSSGKIDHAVSLARSIPRVIDGGNASWEPHSYSAEKEKA